MNANPGPIITYKRSFLALQALCEAAETAADWLCDAEPGTDQYERGIALRNALHEARTAIVLAPEQKGSNV